MCSAGRNGSAQLFREERRLPLRSRSYRSLRRTKGAELSIQTGPPLGIVRPSKEQALSAFIANRTPATFSQAWIVIHQERRCLRLSPIDLFTKLESVGESFAREVIVGNDVGLIAALGDAPCRFRQPKKLFLVVQVIVALIAPGLRVEPRLHVPTVQARISQGTCRLEAFGRVIAMKGQIDRRQVVA